MPTKSYKDKHGRTRYYSAFYYTDYTGTRRKKKREGFLTCSEAKEFEKILKTSTTAVALLFLKTL